MKIYRAYKTELDPNDKQRTALLKHAGVARFTYNWGLKEKIKAYEAKEKTPNHFELSRRLNALKRSEFPWMYEVSKCASQEPLRNLDRAYANFFRRCKQKKAGPKGFPRFKSKHRGIGGFRLFENIRVFNEAIKLPRLEKLRLKEHGYIPTEGVKILSAAVSEKAGRWFVSVQVEQQITDPKPKATAVIGVDLGIKTMAVCSDGKTFENPKALRSHLEHLKHLQRHLSRKQKGSNNRKKAAAKVARLHYKSSNIRKDAINKMTTSLVKTKSMIVIEDLNVAGMLKNHCLAQAIQDLGLAEWRRQLEYKGEWYGCKIVAVDRFFPSSKLCSSCGCLNDALTLADREWTCTDCGVHHDRDRNAALNLEQYGMKLASSSGDRITSPMDEQALAVA